MRIRELDETTENTIEDKKSEAHSAKPYTVIARRSSHQSNSHNNAHNSAKLESPFRLDFYSNIKYSNDGAIRIEYWTTQVVCMWNKKCTHRESRDRMWTNSFSSLFGHHTQYNADYYVLVVYLLLVSFQILCPSIFLPFLHRRSLLGVFFFFSLSRRPNWFLLWTSKQAAIWVYPIDFCMFASCISAAHTFLHVSIWKIKITNPFMDGVRDVCTICLIILLESFACEMWGQKLKIIHDRLYWWHSISMAVFMSCGYGNEWQWNTSSAHNNGGCIFFFLFCFLS